MEDALYGVSALRYHRTPPQVLALMPPVPPVEGDRCRFELRKHPLVRGVLRMPLHFFVTNRAEHTFAQYACCHLQSGELPFGSVVETQHGFNVSSPAMPLFQLARSLPVTQVAMAMYEMCGSFTVFDLSGLPQELSSQVDVAGSLYAGAWRNVRRPDGRPSDLWNRSPLVELSELEQLAKDMRGRRGCRVFERALERVTGVVASPFEAQLSLLLATPRAAGGEGLRSFSNNARIVLSGKAARLAGRYNCYADFLFEETGDKKPLVVECQGRLVHGGADASMSDSDRATALQQMGYNVMLLTYQQIADVKNFDIVRHMLFEEIGLKYREKTERQLDAQRNLRRELFIDWNTLGR